MTKFSWSAIKTHTKNDPIKIKQYFRFLYIPSSCKLEKYIVKIQESKRTKDSFILNLKGVVENKLGGTVGELYWYLYLASLRNIADYQFANNLSLPVQLTGLKEHEMKKLMNNRLLKFENNRIYFKYEGENVWQ